jgi:two-component system, cell cycle sensor histidine kinase and response regulator CckA
MAGIPDPAPSYPAYMKWIALFVLLINLPVILLVGLSLRSSRLQYERQASTIAQSLAQILDKNIAGEIDKIGMVLLTVADEFEAMTGKGGIDDRRLNAFLARYKARLPMIESLRIADKRGLVRYGPGVASPSGISIGNREHFIGPRDNPKAGLYICPPVFAQISRKWALPLSRRLNGPDGTFAGVVYANVEIARFADIFSVIDVGRHGGISLRDDKMGIIARYPAPEDGGAIIGNRTLSPELRKLFEAGKTSGTFFTPTSWDQVPKVVSYRRIAGYPLYVNVGIASEDYLSDWWKEAVIMSALSALFLLLTLFSGWLIYRYMTALRKTTDALKAAHEGLEQRIAERTLQLGLANKALKESEGRLKNLYQESPIPTFTWQKKGEDFLLVDFNRAAARLADGRAGNYLGKGAAQVFEDRREILDDLNLCFRTQAAVEREVVSRDFAPGRLLSVHYGFVPPDMIIVHTEDQTERKRMEEELIRAQKLESLGILAGGIAHDFNNLMTAVLGNVALAKMLLPESNESYPLLKEAIKSTEQAKDLTGRLITFSKGGLSVKNLSDFSGTLREAVQQKTRGTSIQVVFDIENDLKPVEVDEVQIRQVFYNLAMNAVEAMPHGGTLTIKAENIEVDGTISLPLRQGPYLRIIFADTGEGISEENFSRIFDPYFTTKGMGDQKGMGLGLSVCYSVLKKHDGHISVASEPGKGTAFTLYLPVLVETAGEGAPPPSP